MPLDFITVISRSMQSPVSMKFRGIMVSQIEEMAAVPLPMRRHADMLSSASFPVDILAMVSVPAKILSE